MNALLLLAGCWPYVSGDWSDYLPPDAFEPVPVHVAAHASWSSFQGGYWNDENPLDEGSFTWGLLEEPDPAFVAWSWLGGEVGGCIDNPSSDALTELFVRPPMEEDVLTGPLGDIALAVDPDAPVMTGDLRAGDLVEGYPYAWPGQIMGGVAASADVLFRFVPPIETTGPDLDTEELSEIGEDDLRWTWTPVEGPVVVSVLVIVGDGEDAREERLCLAPGSAGEIDLTGDWAARRTDDLWWVRVATTHVSQAFFPESYGAASVLVERGVLGVANRE